MGFEDDLRRIDEHIADARRMVHQQKGLIIRLLGAGVRRGMPKRYFGCWNPTYGDWRNTGTAFGHASMFSKQSDARHCRDTSSVPAAEGHYLSASLAASMPACAQVSSWSAVPPLTPIAPICTLSSVMIGNPPAKAIMPGTSASPGTMPPLRSLP
jgi:hypothetical protein